MFRRNKRARSFPRPQIFYTWILNRYLIMEILPPLSMGLFVFAGALLLVSGRSLIDVLLLSGAPVSQMIKVLIAMFPPLLTMSLPIGCLMASMMVYGRLAEDREVMAMRAAGVNNLSVMLPAVFLGVGLAFFNLFWTTFITPKSLLLLQQANWEIVEQMTSVSWIKPGQFNSPQRDLAFYFTGMEPGSNTLQNITIFKGNVGKGASWFGDDSTEKQASNWTVSAPTATLVPKPGEGLLQLVLRDCISEDFRPDKLSRVIIKQATLSVDLGSRVGKMSRFTRNQRSIREYRNEAEVAKGRLDYYRGKMGLPPDVPHAAICKEAERLIPLEWEKPGSTPLSLTQLRDVEESIMSAQKNLFTAMKRISYPISTLCFMMIGVPLGILTSRGKRSICIIITILTIIVFYSLEKVGETIADWYAYNYTFDPGYAAWTPNILLFLGSLILMRVVARQ